ncbi:SRPBCC family protein [Mycobacterium sp. ACS4331]|uniref:SRPBCC family protein n=1 Tax=Mycobacterium sp. ACS4331 TaxID=1834121 RepID=UPI0007FE9D9E|nr:SRPBCC family protein [Mycobacterium sp. ACS4331]OBF23333.1 polyketide cyclase [Mycobacterium sp. ACS4331]
MARWFALEPADARFLDTAPHIFRYEKHYDAPPEQVWESLQSDESLAAWGNSVSSVTWTSPRPFGVGSSRVVALGPSQVREHFFRWDEGQGYSFYVTEANAPLFRRFAEDYVVLPDGTGTRFIWKVAIEPRHALRLPFKALAPVLRAAFGRLASDGGKYFATR